MKDCDTTFGSMKGPAEEAVTGKQSMDEAAEIFQQLLSLLGTWWVEETRPWRQVQRSLKKRENVGRLRNLPSCIQAGNV